MVTLKSELEVTQCHWNWCHSKVWVRFPSYSPSIVTHLSDRIVNKWNSLSEDIISASSLNNFKGKLQRLYNDGSSTGFFKSEWLSGPSQFPGEAQSGKLSGKLTVAVSVAVCEIFRVKEWRDLGNQVRGRWRPSPFVSFSPDGFWMNWLMMHSLLLVSDCSNAGIILGQNYRYRIDIVKGDIPKWRTAMCTAN